MFAQYFEYYAIILRGGRYFVDTLVMALLLLAGMKDGQQIRFSAEGDQEPGIEPGDVIVVLDEQKHGVFKRRGNDLFVDFEIDLVDALCGFQKTIETLDKRTLLVTSLPGILFSSVIVIYFYWLVRACHVNLYRVNVMP